MYHTEDGSDVWAPRQKRRFLLGHMGICANPLRSLASKHSRENRLGGFITQTPQLQQSAFRTAAAAAQPSPPFEGKMPDTNVVILCLSFEMIRLNSLRVSLQLLSWVGKGSLTLSGPQATLERCYMRVNDGSQLVLAQLSLQIVCVRSCVCMCPFLHYWDQSLTTWGKMSKANFGRWNGANSSQLLPWRQHY